MTRSAALALQLLGVLRMREFIYTKAEVKDAFCFWAPKLREFAAACRLQRPLPDRDTLSAAHREQYRILCSALKEFRDSPIGMPEPYLDVYHGSPITLLAATEIFDPCSDSIVLLLSEER